MSSILLNIAIKEINYGKNKIILDYENDYWLLISLIPLSYILHLIAFRKFTKEHIQGDTNFYL